MPSCLAIKSQVALAEADRIATYIKGEVAAGRRHYRNFLVLTRATPRLGIYAAACERLAIPVEVSGAGRLLESTEVAALSLLLRSLADPLDALSLVGFAAALGLAAPVAVLTASRAGAQTSGMERRGERRTGRHERRQERRTGRTERREERRN